MNFRTFSADAFGSSPVSPIISTPRDLYSLCSFMSSGISRRHGPHQVAQKLTTTTLPKKSASLKGAPFASFSGAIATSGGKSVHAGGVSVTTDAGVGAATLALGAFTKAGV